MITTAVGGGMAQRPSPAAGAAVEAQIWLCHGLLAAFAEYGRTMTSSSEGRGMAGRCLEVLYQRFLVVISTELA